MIYKITPVPKPRMTQRDKWLQPPRKCVEKYWSFKDEVLRLSIHVPEAFSHIIFHMPMPKSWSKKKKLKMCASGHQSRPDKDNLEKALLDAIYDEDSVVWDSRVSKVWAWEGAIEINNQ